MIQLLLQNAFFLEDIVLHTSAKYWKRCITVCFMSSADVNVEALREVYPKARSIGCFIKKPVTISYLVKRHSAELD
jgi:hypothetical protein